jgi:glutamyl-tRNA reductase
VPPDEFTGAVLAHSGADAVSHLFQVACSIDSMVLGEPQIVNQVKEAYRVAQQNSACGPLTNVLFQYALKVSAQVRTENGSGGWPSFHSQRSGRRLQGKASSAGLTTKPCC